MEVYKFVSINQDDLLDLIKDFSDNLFYVIIFLVMFMQKILIVEDDYSIHGILKEMLKLEGYIIYDAYEGKDALNIIQKEDINLILLDLMLPDINGEEIIKKIKNIPIIIISAKVSSNDKINCLLNGANDYVTKPFDKNELLARIKVQLRNNKQNNELKYKELHLLNDHQTLMINKEEVKLTKTEYLIIKELLQNTNRVVTKNMLLDLISIDNLDCDENSLKVHISNIRKKLRKYTSNNYIEAIWGIGFKIKE